MMPLPEQLQSFLIRSLLTEQELETRITKAPSSILIGGNFVDDFAIPYM